MTAPEVVTAAIGYIAVALLFGLAVVFLTAALFGDRFAPKLDDEVRALAAIATVIAIFLAFAMAWLTQVAVPL